MINAPYELLTKWINHVEIGRALDLGAGDGEVSLWLAENGFDVDAVEQNPTSFDRLKEATSGATVHCFRSDIREIQFEPEAYTLITSFGILHFIRPTDLWTVVDQLVASLAPGGVLICEVFTTDDPGFDVLRRGGVEMIEPNTFRSSKTKNQIHYFEPGELERVFSALEIIEAEEYRRLDPRSEEGFRAGAAFVGRKRK